MKIDKSQLIKAIGRFLTAKEHELRKAQKLVEKYEQDRALYEAAKEAWIVKKAQNLTVHDRPKISMGSVREGMIEITASFSVSERAVPKTLLKEPKEPMILETSYTYHRGRSSYSTRLDTLKREISDARDKLSLIKMATGGTVDVNTKQIMESISPYLPYV